MTAARLRRGLPLLVSLALVIGLLSRFDLRATLAAVTPDVLVVFLPALVVYAAVSLAVEARSLQQLLPATAPLGLATCARIKAASYPLSLLHYALGGAALSVLLSRRTRQGIADAAGVVMLISAADLFVLVVLCALSAPLAVRGTASAPALQAGVLALAAMGLAAGLVLLRSDWRVGPLERLRALAVFRAARDLPLRHLLELGLLRGVFIVVFVALAGVSLYAFGVRVPLPNLVLNFAAISLVAVLPIAVAGLGTGQVAFVYLFGAWSGPEDLLACSLTLSAGIIALRAGLGLLFARELVREAYVATSASGESGGGDAGGRG